MKDDRKRRSQGEEQGLVRDKAWKDIGYDYIWCCEVFR